MRLTYKSMFFAPLALSAGVTLAAAQDAASTGYAGDPLGVSIRSVEGTPANHSIACLDRSGSESFDCIVWTASDMSVVAAQAVSSGTTLLGLHAVDPEFSNPAVAFVIDGREVPSSKIARVADGLEDAVGELGGAARISVRQPGDDVLEFVAPGDIGAAFDLDAGEEMGRLWRAVDTALDDLTQFEGRPRTLVLAAGTAFSERRVGQLVDKTNELGIRTVILRLDGTDEVRERLAAFAGGTDGSFIDLSSDVADLPPSFASRLSSAWRLAFHRDTSAGRTDVVALRFSDGTRTEFVASANGEAVVRVGGEDPMASFHDRLTNLVPNFRTASMFVSDIGNSVWIGLLGLAGLTLGWSLVSMRRKKVAIVPMPVETPAAENIAARDVAESEIAETEMPETDIATEIARVARIEFAGDERVETLGTGTVRIGRERKANDVVVDAQVVSRRHAAIHVSPDGRATIENLTVRPDSPSRAPNAIILNGAAINGIAELADGDEVHLGNENGVTFRYVKVVS